jgi:hypothetical protein
MIKKISCPKCENQFNVEGVSGEIKSVICPKCSLKGKYIFPEEKETPKIIEEKFSRPLGITILAILQIIGTISLIILLIVIPLIFDESINEFMGFPILEFLIIYSLLMIPISLLLAYGLFTGKEWARFTSVLFQAISIITSILRFNILGVIIPILIIYYLYKPHVKDYFRTEQGFKTNIKAIIIVGIVILLIVNCYIAILTNPL